MSILDGFKKWNLFRANEEKPPDTFNGHGGMLTSRRPDRSYFRHVNGKEITNSIYTRIAVDAANVDLRHVKINDNGQFTENVKSALNDCLTIEANIDQGATHFRQDIFQTLLEQGTIAVVPTDTDDPPSDQNKGDFASAFVINTMRVGTIASWRPTEVTVRLFREEHAKYEELPVPKTFCAVIENPFYSIMNEPSGTLQRLTRKISLLDAIDEQIGAGKLDLIIQLPYIVKGDTKKRQAEERRAALEEQLRSSNMGVAYADGTEKVIQLNRPVENNLLKNVEYLTNMLYSQLGITEEVLNGTASEEVMLNYQTRIIKPLLQAVTEAFNRRFITKTARSQGHSIEYFLDPFALVPIGKIASIGDALTRNAILSPNEVRGIIGFKPSTDGQSDKLVNRNMPVSATPEAPVIE